MATEAPTSHHTSTTVQPIENKMNEEVKPIEPETVSLANKSEENSVVMELPNQSHLSPKSDGEEITTADDAPVEVKTEVEKDSIPASLTHSAPEPVAGAIGGQPVAKAALKSAATEEQQVMALLEEEVYHEQLKAVDKSSDEVIEKPQELSDVIPIKDAEVFKEKEAEDSTPSKEIDKPVLVVPETEGKPEEQSEVNKQVEKPELDEAIEKQQEHLGVLPIKSEAVVVKDIDDSEPGLKEVEKPESVLPVKEQSEGTQQVDKQEEQSLQAIEKTDGPLVHPIEGAEAVLIEYADDSKVPSKEADKQGQVVPEVPVELEEQSEVIKPIKGPESVTPEVEEKLEEQSEVTKQVEEPQIIAPEVQMKPEAQAEVDKQVESEIKDAKPEPMVREIQVKPEAQAEVAKQVEAESKDAKPESAVHQIQVKPEAQAEVAKQVEAESKDEKPEPAVPEIQVKPEAQAEVAKQVAAESTDAKPEPVAPEVELKPEGQTKVVGRSTESENVKDEEKRSANLSLDEVVSTDQEVNILKEDEGSPLPDITERVEDDKKETKGTDVVELSRESVVETGNAGDEKEGNTFTTESKNEEKEVQNKGLAQPIEAEGVSSVVSNAGVTETVEAIMDNIKKETTAVVETSKDGDIERKTDEVATTVNELVKESQGSGSEAKEAESEKTNEDELQKAKVEDGDDSKITQEAPREVSAKPAQKQSNNILSKVKHSLVKAKKAIVGKSPSSKTLSSDTKGDIKVK